jgi:hypothetical protein
MNIDGLTAWILAPVIVWLGGMAADALLAPRLARRMRGGPAAEA